MKVIAALVSTLMLLASVASLADTGVSYVFGMSAGIRNTDFDFDATAGPVFVSIDPDSGQFVRTSMGSKNSFEYDETLYTVGFTAGLSFEQFYVSGLLELTPESEETNLHVTSISDSESLSPSQSDDRRTDLERSDLSLTLGYQVWEGLSVFSGYRYAEWEAKSLESNFILNNKDQKYTEKGFFIGSSYTWGFGEKGTLSISGAYAYLDADFSEDNVSKEYPPGEQTFGEFSYSGTATGLSYGAQWSGPLTDQWVYKVGLKFQKYESDNNSTTLEINSPPVSIADVPFTDIETTQTDSTFSVGVVRVF